MTQHSDQVKRFTKPAILAMLAGAAMSPGLYAQTVPIRIGFLWHMHQPIYYPGESIIQTNNAGHYSFSVVDVHNQRFGPYTTWPAGAVNKGLSMPHFGAHVSFSGSLIQNLNTLEGAGVNGGMWNNWKGPWRSAQSQKTALGNTRLDMIGFGYYHPLLPLLDEPDMRMHLRLQRHINEQTWGPSYEHSKGIFPPETAFSTRLIPALVAEGYEWILVDNIHFDRACVNYPHSNASGIYPPNKADQRNPDPAASGGAWVQLQNLWAPTQVSVPFGYQPHKARHVDPETGTATTITVVPAARYEGNEDGRGGYGAFLYDQVMDAYLPYNTDADRPMLVVLHHDGDNFGGGSEGYYNHNFQNMVNWVSTDPDYEVTQIQDYLDRFPVPSDAIIHVGSGSWAGADAGDPEFRKWLGPADANGWSPDQNSWAVITAAKNRVFHAESLAPAVNLNNIINGAGTVTERAWHWLLTAQHSDYWYWDGTEVWDSNATRACNNAVAVTEPFLAGQPDTVGPTIFLPQRTPYNPGEMMWGPQPEPSDFEVWTFVDDFSGLQSVTLKYRVDFDGVRPLNDIQNETYAGGPGVGPWQSIAMTTSAPPTPPPGAVIPATRRAPRYSAMISGEQSVLLDYYVEAVDAHGNISRSPIQHVWVGDGTPGGGGGPSSVTITPNPAIGGQSATITYDAAGGPLASASQVYLHYGYNGWASVISPDPAMTYDPVEEVWTISVPVNANASQISMVFNNGAGTWDNNNGADWHFSVVPDPNALPEFEMDGSLDAGVQLMASANGLNLWADLRDGILYLATESARNANDHFIYVALNPGAMQTANWGKAGQIAAWDAFLGNEADNNWSGWFDATGSTQQASSVSGVLEGTIDLVGQYGVLPQQIAVAVGAYQTPNGGALVAQVPAAVTPNANIEADEYLIIDLSDFLPPPACPGDINGDGATNLDDFIILAGNFGTTSGATLQQGDLNGDGAVNLDDFIILAGDFGCSN